MTELRFTAEHEWIRFEDGVATIGITAHAADQLGDIVFVELPETGREVAAGEACAVVESVKAASDIFAPLAGQVTATNEAVVADPAMIGRAPMADGWLFRMTLAEAGALADLMDEAAYTALVEAA